MKINNILGIAALGFGIYWFATRNATAQESGGYYSPAGMVSPETTPQTFTTTTPEQKTATYSYSTPASGVAAINAAIQNNEILPRTSQTIKVLGQNDTIAKLANGAIVRVTTKNIPVGKSYFDKPIKTINGKRTRNY